MKAIFKKLLCAAVAGILLLLAIPVTAHADDAFTITNYDVSVQISKKNVYNISETIAVHFNEAKHGIFRTIPINTKFDRTGPDGVKTSTRVSSDVSDVQVTGYPFTVNTEDNVTTIKIGDADTTVTGNQTYQISYKMTFGNDGVNAFDEAYYNIIGTDWDAPIDHVSFKVTLPNIFDAEQLGFSLGSRGATGYDPAALAFKVDGNTITGETLKPLYNYQGITMRLQLPPGYFDVPDIRLPDWIIMGIVYLMTILSIILFIAFGRDKKPVETVEFEAPDGMTPPEVGFAFRGNASETDMVSMLIYWADRGYLTIQKDGAHFVLHKLKNLNAGAKDFEAHMFEALFRGRDTVKNTDLQYKYYKVIESAVSMLQLQFGKDDTRIFKKQSQGIKPWITLMSLVPFFITVPFAFNRTDIGLGGSIVMGLMAGVGLLLPFFFLNYVLTYWQPQHIKSQNIKLAVGLVLCGFTTWLFLRITLDGANEPLLPWLAATATFIMNVCSGFSLQRTPKGVYWLGRILGFRNFIVTAEEDKLKMLVEENPDYFYHILPYAYVLGITDKWVKKFEGITLAPPDWYTGFNEPFSPLLFAGAMHSTLNTFQSNMTSTYSSGSSSGGGSGFSGGSSSGGGGGGGGGGSW